MKPYNLPNMWVTLGIVWSGARPEMPEKWVNYKVLSKKLLFDHFELFALEFYKFSLLPKKQFFCYTYGNEQTTKVSRNSLLRTSEKKIVKIS